MAAGLVLPLAAWAQSKFDGTWKLDPNSGQFEGKPDLYLLEDGVYRCPTCDPPIDVKADGTDQTVAANACYDTVSIKVIDERTLEEVHKKKGTLAENAMMTVTEDGRTARIDWTTRCNARNEPVTDSFLETRVAPGPAGAHLISGSWTMSKKLGLSDNAMTGIIKLEGDTFSFMDPVGQGYTAKLDGTETPTKGELGHHTVSVRRLGNDTVEETDRDDGKAVEVIRYTVSPDGKTMTLTMENKVQGTRSQYTLIKQ
jgi:hypothetical protein